MDAAQANRAREIYEASFPKSQRVPFDALLASDGDANRVQLVGLQEGAVLVVLTMSWLESTDWWFLEYLAVAPETRSQGIGTRAWNEAIKRAGGSDAARIVFEVDPPEEADIGSSERAIRQRRVDFYRRLGAELLPLGEFHAPATTGDGLQRFALMARTTAKEVMPAGPALGQLAASVLTDGYGLNPGDPLVRRALDTGSAVG